jgi:hypothetical protein
MTDRWFIEANRSTSAEMRALVESLSDEDLAVDLGGGWTVSMALAHLAFWDAWHVARWVHAAENGLLAPPAADAEVTNRANDALLATWRALPPRAAIAVMLDAADVVDAYTADLSDDAVELALERDGSRWLDRSPHRRDHIDQISRALGLG